MPEEKIVYRDAITNLIEGLRPRLSPRGFARLLSDAGVDEKALKPSYPLAAHDAVIKILAEDVFPGKPFDVATYEVGRAMLEKYYRGPLGRALAGLIRLIGPMRMMKRVPEYFRQTNNYADVKIEITGPSSYVLEHNEVGSVPHYWRGTLQGSGQQIGLPDHAVELLEYDGHRARFRVSWRA